MGKIVYTVQSEYEGTRIDSFLSDQDDGLSRNYIQKLIKDGALSVNKTPQKASYKIKSEDIIELDVPEDQEPEILPENLHIESMYEDEDIIVVNKPKGMVVHPAAGHFSGTLVNALLYHCKDLSGINGILRPGIVHRIDKDTSGLIVCAKNDNSHKKLAEQLKAHSMTRCYEAICCGRLKEPSGVIDAPIGRDPSDRKLMAINYKNGKNAVTHYELIEDLGKYSYIKCVLETGRTHQIRVHMSSIKHPLIGDKVYGGRLSEFKLNGKELSGQTLHAKTLGFIHPAKNEYMEFEAPLPEYFTELLDKLRRS